MPRLNDIGLILRLTIKKESDDTALDISGTTTKNVLIEKPSGTLLTKAGSFTTDGTDGKLQWTTVDTDLNEVGLYEIQAHVVDASVNLKSTRGQFTVDQVLT